MKTRIATLVAPFFFFLMMQVVAQVPLTKVQQKKPMQCDMNLTQKEMVAYKEHVAAEKNFEMNRDGELNLPIQFHILRRTNGTGGLNPEDVAWEMDRANEKFAPTGIEFFQCSPAQFIDDDDYFNTEFNYEWDDFCGQTTAEYLIAGEYNVQNVINVYYVNTDGWNWSAYPDWKTSKCKDWIIMDIADTGTNHILAHELGHYFNLLHTFQGYDDGEVDNEEHITRNPDSDCYNCTEYGDLLCDTEADNNNWDNSCGWDGTGSDGCTNLGFNPDPQNIMSYSDCPEYFTEGQIGRILFAAMVLRAYLECPYLSDCNTNWQLGGVQTSMFAYQASDFITSTADINSGVTSAYDATSYVKLKVGFEAKSGSDFHAFIDGCWGPEIFREEDQHEALGDSGEGNSSLVVYPNPGAGLFFLQCDLKADLDLSIEVFDQLGRKILESDDAPSSNSFTHPLDLRSFPDGSYLVRVVQGDKVRQATIIKTH